MSASKEYSLAKTLLWSKTDFTLAEFVKQYELPQVVLVEVGYCGIDERTTFSSDQILTLHTVRTNSKIMCVVPPGNAVLVPSSCRLKAEVIPMECNDRIVNAHLISTIYKKVKYIRVFEIGSTRNNNMSETFKVGDILQIKKVDMTNSVLRCKNIKTEENIMISTDSTTAFVPLADPNTYTLAEIQKRFGLPAKMRFTDKSAELRMRSVPGQRQPTMMLSNLDQITAVEGIQDKDVIVTTVCSDPKETACLDVPVTLDIRVTVAEGFLSGDETYQKVVKTLNENFKRTDLTAFQELNIFQYDDAVKREMANHITVEEASKEMAERARKRLEQVIRNRSKKLIDLSKKPPRPPPRKSYSEKDPKNMVKTPPPRPPKPGSNPRSRPEPKVKKLGTNLTNKFKSLGRKPSSEKNSSTNDSSSSNDDYEEPTGIYASIDDVFDETDTSDSENYEEVSVYTELDDTYKPKSLRSYESLIEKSKSKETALPFQQSNPLPSIPPLQKCMSLPYPRSNHEDTQLPPQTVSPPPIPTSKPPCSKEDKQAIYEAIARYPQDLTGLSVTDVSKLLRYLNLSDYVETFENELMDGTMLSSLDKETLESLDVKPFHCKKLLDFIGGWRPKV